MQAGSRAASRCWSRAAAPTPRCRASGRRPGWSRFRPITSRSVKDRAGYGRQNAPSLPSRTTTARSQVDSLGWRFGRWRPPKAAPANAPSEDRESDALVAGQPIPLRLAVTSPKAIGRGDEVKSISNAQDPRCGRTRMASTAVLNNQPLSLRPAGTRAGGLTVCTPRRDDEALKYRHRDDEDARFNHGAQHVQYEPERWYTGATNWACCLAGHALR